jgi:hypothetical protein
MSLYVAIGVFSSMEKEPVWMTLTKPAASPTATATTTRDADSTIRTIQTSQGWSYYYSANKRNTIKDCCIISTRRRMGFG